MLSVLMEGLKKTDHIYGDVGCDLCSERKMKAVKSCLQCLVSYCKDHLQPHYDVAALKRHKLIEPRENLQDNICSQHNEVMKMFCRTDQLCICYLCSLDQHKGHDVVTAVDERTEREGDLDTFQHDIIQRIKSKQKDVLGLQQEARNIRSSADTALHHCEISFKGLIAHVEEKISSRKEYIKSQREWKTREAKERQDELQREITALKKQLREMETVSHTEDHGQFLHNIKSLSKLNLRTVEVYWHAPEDVLPVSRDHLLQFACDLTLDPNTLHNSLVLSAGNTKISRAQRSQNYHTHPERFTDQLQVLSRDALPDHCYIEVNLNYNSNIMVFKQGVKIGVTYKDVERDGEESRLEFNESAFVLMCSEFGNHFFVNYTIGTKEFTCDRVSKVGIYLNKTLGLLQFYNLSDPKFLMVDVKNTFTQPLYLVLGLCGEMDSVEICKLT